MSGKGSGRRPAAITKAEVDANWERTFGKKPATFEEQVRVNLGAMTEALGGMFVDQGIGLPAETGRAKNDALNGAATQLQDGLGAAAQSIVVEEYDRIMRDDRRDHDRHPSAPL